MRILFVSSGNRGISPIVSNQGVSLIYQGVIVKYFPIIGKGLLGYLSNIIKLRKFLQEEKFDVVHAHYSLTAFVVSMANAKPLVVSLMGSDVKKGLVFRLIIRVFAFLYSWKNIIVKSEDMRSSLNIDNVMIIPNGVNLKRFREIDRVECRKRLGWDMEKKHILFPANIARPEKNYHLLDEAEKKLNDSNIEVHWFNNVPNEDTPYWYNAADVVVMTSLWEGSPNAIKEAMACGTPVVSVDVGDVKEVMGNTDGCYIAERNPDDIADKIRMALAFKGKTNGRQRIIDLGLSNDLVAKKLIEIYNEVLKK